MKNKENFVSIIVPCSKIDSYTLECVKHCNNLDYNNYEIIVLPDRKPDKEQFKDIKSKKLKIIATVKVVPAIKRNI